MFEHKMMMVSDLEEKHDKNHKTLKQIIVPSYFNNMACGISAGILNTYIIPPPVEILDTAIILLKGNPFKACLE